MNLGDFQDRRSTQLRDSLRYNIGLIVLCMAIGVVAGVGLGDVRPATYSSSTTLLINQIPGNPYTPDSNSDTLEMLQTEAVAATSQAVMRQVATDVGLGLTPESLRKHSFVDVPPNTQALRITYSSTKRSIPAVVVNAIAKDFLATRQAQAQGTIDSQVANLTTQLTNARTALKAANAINDPNASAIRATIIDIQSRIATAKSAATQPGLVLTPGTIPSGSPAKHLIVYGIGGLILGSLVGLSLAVWRERRRDLIRSVVDLQDYALDAPVTLIRGAELDNESLRHLRMRLAAQIKSQGVVGLVGLSTGQASWFGVLLGSSLASSGTSVALIDGTGTETGHRDILGLSDKPGLAEALIGADVPTVYAIDTNLDYVPAGTDAQSASVHLVDERAQDIVQGIAKRHDLTLIACMPLDNVEGEALARLTDSIVVLIQLNKTSHFELGTALRALTGQGLQLTGLFILPPRP